MPIHVGLPVTGSAGVGRASSDAPHDGSQLVLASTSPARRALLGSLGLPFRAEAPGVDELVPNELSVLEAVAVLAERKARAVAARSPGVVVIGADQLVSLDGRALGKPDSAEAAREQLASLAGRTHEIATGICVIGGSGCACEVDVVRITVYPLSSDELDGYVATGEWQGCAGGYRIEGRGQALFSRVEGCRTSVQGLPMERLVRLLREAGVRFFV